MRSWKALIGALMLVLMFWAGGPARAAERVGCIPATAQAPGHYEGDDKLLPSDRDAGGAHHHTGCSLHQLAAPAEQPAIIVNHSSAKVTLARSDAHPHGHDPDGQLRPPMV